MYSDPGKASPILRRSRFTYKDRRFSGKARYLRVILP
jgi:hypothetical protein